MALRDILSRTAPNGNGRESVLFQYKGGIALIISPEELERARQTKRLALPEKASAPLRLYEYLCQKCCIDGEIVNELIHEGKLYQDRLGNAVFVGFNEHNKPRFASVRGLYGENSHRFDCAGSDKRYGFNMAYSDSDQLYIYESPIGAMSHASMENISKDDKDAWKRSSRLSLGGLSDAAIPKHLEMHPHVKELVFCLDNDLPGQDASTSLSKKYAAKGYITRIEPPLGKDFSIDLIVMKNRVQREMEILQERGKIYDR